ncbi:MAG TPA: alpha/beta hydrolase, partial [Urbifossiella sp.]|nr:alpha/beta hydrolase [Urbifossiella sp.]
MIRLSPASAFGRRLRRFALRRLPVFAGLYATVVAGFMAAESRLVFPGGTFAASWRRPADPRTQDVRFMSADGPSLHGWWLPPTRPDAGAFVVAHGNNANLTRRGQCAADLNRVTGAGVLLFDYPGYGRSEGRPTEAGCYAAGDAAYDWVTGEAGVPPGRVILIGESLGTAVAVDLATRHDHRALVLLAPFTSLPAAARSMLPFLPTHTLMRSRFDSLSKIARCTRPLFVAHGTSDSVVPFRQGEALFAAANGPKEFLRLDGLRHNVLGSHL